MGCTFATPHAAAAPSALPAAAPPGSAQATPTSEDGSQLPWSPLSSHPVELGTPIRTSFGEAAPHTSGLAKKRPTLEVLRSSSGGQGVGSLRKLLQPKAPLSPTQSASLPLAYPTLDELIAEMRREDERLGRRSSRRLHADGDESASSAPRHRRQSSETMLARLVRGGSTLGMALEAKFSPSPGLLPQSSASSSSLMSGAAAAAASAVAAPNHFPGEQPVSTSALVSFLVRENLDTGMTERELDALAERKTPWWEKQDVQAYLYSAHNELEHKRALNAPHDMTRPLTEYFISASHNTYLVGGQYAMTGGRVDVHAYSRALQQGCRCVEIDVYDGPDGDPIVMHVNATVGGGACTFLEVVACVARDAFRGGFAQSPLVLNLENNMFKQTRRAAEIMVGAFGARIVRSTDEEFGWEGRVLPPSPLDLAGRVLVRSKTRGACSEYLDLLYFVNSPWGSFDVSRPFCLSSSLAENKVAKAVKGRPLVEINQKYLNRVYPKSTAVSSQNFNPLPLWLMGFQLVALNLQTAGLEADVNKAMFARGGNSGLVLKPALMRRGFTNTALSAKLASPVTSLHDLPSFASEENSDDADGGVEEEDDEQNEKLDAQALALIEVAREDKKRQRFRRKSTGGVFFDNVDTAHQGMVASAANAGFAAPLRLPMASPNLTSSARALMPDRLALPGSGNNNPLPKIKERPLMERAANNHEDAGNPVDAAGSGPRSKVSINSVEITVIGIKNNAGADERRLNKTRWFSHSHLHSHEGAGAAARGGGGNMTPTSQPHSSKHADAELGEDVGEHLAVELVVDGDQRDRAMRKTQGAACVKSGVMCKFPDKDLLAVILNDSESALLTLRIVAEDGAERAARSFFAHCIRPGEYDLCMFGPFGLSYTLTLNFKPVYSYFSLVSQRHVLFDAEDPPLLPVPNKTAGVEVVVLSARAEIAGLDLRKCDPYVQIQVAGVQADVRDVRTPRVSKCAGGGGLEGGGSGCQWLYPLSFTLSWSEFAFMRFSLRSFDGQAGGAESAKPRSRRGSLVQTFSSVNTSHVIGRRCLWVEAFRSGYRSVQLFNQSERLVATLLCHFTVKDARTGTFDVSERVRFMEKMMGR